MRTSVFFPPIDIKLKISNTASNKVAVNNLSDSELNKKTFSSLNNKAKSFTSENIQLPKLNLLEKDNFLGKKNFRKVLRNDMFYSHKLPKPLRVRMSGIEFQRSLVLEKKSIEIALEKQKENEQLALKFHLRLLNPLSYREG
ncbi:hypothetical protein HK099_006565 [Clydaea vesicula]|uniref:Uncharacterized protein n=1 Tax=Clydaea vesicula TaxID=447962 RepID=A0AAD5U115_9FUNG|nr:hypothetical protein HK099_006565 [Clydaea vesicula]